MGGENRKRKRNEEEEGNQILEGGKGCLMGGWVGKIEKGRGMKKWKKENGGGRCVRVRSCGVCVFGEKKNGEKIGKKKIGRAHV